MSDQTRDVDASAIAQAIGDYLYSGGLFNPEMARHDLVRDLLIDARHALAARAADAQTIATLRAEVERSGDALAIERGLVTIYRNDVERHAQTIAALRDENARLKAELDARNASRDRAVDLLERAVSHLGFWEGIRADIIAYLAQRQE